ncbi:MAG: oligopeptide transporter, OPT family [Acidobacteria bacterium]|nr:oligopeptide transporter, OPT family [Acidobacteriota bacterium]
MASDGSLPEITLKAIILGVLLSVILSAANAYLGLFAGMTVSASIPAAVVSMGILRLFRRSNILENNIVQTAASAGEALAAGVIFTIPALVIMDSWESFDYRRVTIIAGFGGLLGVLFTIPLRRALIVEDGLKFPEGIATAEVLESGQKGGKDIWIIVKSALAGGLFKLGAGSGFGLLPDTVEAARRFGGTVGYLGTNLSPALLAVGYIVGLNIAVLIVLGGALNWLVAVPICAVMQEWPLRNGAAMAPLDFANIIWSSQTRYLGVGGMLVGGLWTVFKLRSSILGGIRGGLAAYQNAKDSGPALPRTEMDMPMKWILILIIGSIAPLFLLYRAFVADITVSAAMALIMLAAGFLFAAVAGYMSGIVGASNNPISGVTIATVTVSALLLVLLMGSGNAQGPSAAILIGAVICCAASIAGDNLQDLKTGYIVKSTPWKQQVMQMVGTVSAALVLAPILTLLLKAYGFAGHSSARANPLIAAQANLMASVSRGVFSGDLPWDFVGIGALLAALIIVLDEYLLRRGSSFRTPVLAVTIGIYLPLQLETPILAGGIVWYFVKLHQQRKQHTPDIVEKSGRRGLLFASGLITGEAIVGILLAIPIVATGKPDFMIFFKHPPALVSRTFSALGLVLLGMIALWLYRLAREPGTE